MNYQLAKKLKESGFQQQVICPHGEDTLCECRENFEAGKQTEPYTPTLEELIESCGDKFENLAKSGSVWFCNEFLYGGDPLEDGFETMGKTPKEAVANLWLELNKKR